MSLLENVSATWAIAAWAATWQGSCLALVVWLLCRWWASMPARCRAWLWWIVAAKFVVGYIPPLVPLALLSGSNAPPATQSPASVWLVPLFIVWSIGMLLVIRTTFMTWRIAALQFRKSEPTERQGLVAECQRLCFFLGIKDMPKVREILDLRTPILTGSRRPTIILPGPLADVWSADEMRMMLAHELGHLKRRDLIYGWAPAVAQITGWFNPFVRLAVHEWELAQEIACDEVAVEVTATPPFDYGNMLLAMALPPRPRAARPTAVAFWVSKKTLRRRLLALYYVGNWTKLPARVAALAAMAAVALTLVPWQVAGASNPTPPSATQSPTIALTTAHPCPTAARLTHVHHHAHQAHPAANN